MNFDRKIEVDMRSVCFLFNGVDQGPCGGYKVVYEYANRLVRAGWRVTIAYSFLAQYQNFWLGIIRHPISYGWCYLRYLHSRLHKTSESKVREWFDLDERVKLVYPFRLGRLLPLFLPRGTCWVAGYVTTAICLNRFWVKNKIQLIQGREDWYGITLKKLYETYRYPIRKVVISKWLQDEVVKAGSTAELVSNGLDFDYFQQTNPIEGRKPTEVAMLWHRDERKRTGDAVAALEKVRRRHADLHVVAFGVPDKPVNLPSWITYIQKPTRECHNQIYNTAAIFIASSEQEGWGLTPCEAMICGAAVVCTDIGGYREFAENGVTALMSPVGDISAMADNICEMIEDRSLRIRIAQSGAKKIRRFTWDSSFKKLEKILER